MKKLFPLLAALAFGFTACASQAVSVPDPAGEGAATDTVSDTAAEYASTMPVGTLHDLRLDWYTVSDNTMYRIHLTYAEDGFTVSRQSIVETDLSTGAQQEIYSELDPAGYLQFLFTVNGTLYAQGYEVNSASTIYAFPNGQCTKIPVPEDFTPVCYDESALYAILDAFIGQDGSLVRLDLQTQAVTRMPLPQGTAFYCGANNGEILLTRWLTDQPLPDFDTNPELYNSLLQNARSEYVWFDPAANTMRTIYSCAAPNGMSVGETLFLGEREGVLYLEQLDSYEEATDTGHYTVYRVNETDGSLQLVWNPEPSQSGNFFLNALECNGDLTWLAVCRREDGQGKWIYNLADGKTYEAPQLTENICISTLLPDGRLVLMQSDYTANTVRFYLADEAAFLNGSTDWQAVPDMP